MRHRRTSKESKRAPQKHRRLRVCRFELLEPRIALAVNASPFAPISWSTQANGLPNLNSLPTAPAMIFLDFDGDAGQGISEFDLDDTPGEFTPAEQKRIVEHWRGVSAMFSMFNVGVTTNQPAASKPTAWLAITNDMNGRGGVNGVNSFPDNAPSGTAGSDFWASGFAHELSHGFGNWHQSTYDFLGNKTAEYGGAADPLRGPIMGSGGGAIEKWANGHTSLDITSGVPDVRSIQDDMARIAAHLNAVDGAGDGYRPDDQLGTSIAGATPLTIINSTTQGRTGIIERLTDQDWFSFTSAGGTYNVLVGRDNPSPVDVKISIYNPAGTLLGSEDGDPRAAATEGTSSYRTMVNDSHVTLALAAGTYFIKVESHGNYADQGQYIVRVDTMQEDWQSEDIGFVGAPGFTTFDVASGTYTLGGSGRGISGAPAQGGDATHFAYRKLVGDGQITARITSLDTVSELIRGGITMRESLATGSKNVSLFATPNDGVTRVQRLATDGNTTSNSVPTTAFAPFWLRIVRAGNTFASYYSFNGVNWGSFGGAQTISMGSELFVGLLASSGNNNTPWDNNWLGVATFTNVSITGLLPVPNLANELPSPSNVAISSFTNATINITWSQPPRLPGDFNADGVVDAADYVVWRSSDGSPSGYDAWRSSIGVTQPIATGFDVERSSDGVNFTIVATTTANDLAISDTNLLGNQRYFYRVRSKLGSAVSAPSTVVYATTRAAAITELRLYSYSTSQLVLDWKDTSGEVGYRVESSSNGIDGWATVGTPAKNTRIFVNSGLTANTPYYYRVVTLGAGNYSTISTVINAYTRVNAAPANLRFTARNPTSLHLAWDALPGTSRYVLYRGRSEANNEWDIVNSNILGTSFIDTSVSQLNEYHYRLVGYTSAGAASLTSSIFGATTGTSPLASPWVSQDIGTVGGPGAAGQIGGEIEILGGGADVWGTTDEFHFVSQPLLGDGAITAFVPSMENPAASFYSRAGIMIRETTATGSRYASMMLHPSEGGVRLQSRAATNGLTSEINGPIVNAPYWLRLTRTGNTFIGEISPNGSAWSIVGSVNVAMPADVRVGMAVTARNDDFLHWGRFDNVSVIQTGIATGDFALHGSAVSSGPILTPPTQTATTESVPPNRQVRDKLFADLGLLTLATLSPSRQYNASLSSAELQSRRKIDFAEHDAAFTMVANVDLLTSITRVGENFLQVCSMS